MSLFSVEGESSPPPGKSHLIAEIYIDLVSLHTRRYRNSFEKHAQTSINAQRTLRQYLDLAATVSGSRPVGATPRHPFVGSFSSAPIAPPS